MTGAPTAQKPRAPRYKAFQPCAIATAGGESRAHVLNISASGALVHLGLRMAQGLRLTLKCGLLSTTGKVVWSHDHRAGIAFDAVLPDGELNAVLGGPPVVRCLPITDR